MTGKTQQAFSPVEQDPALLAAIVASSTDAILSNNSAGTIMTWNAAAEAMFGYSVSEILGQSVFQLIPDHAIDGEREILTKASAGQTVNHYETSRIRKDGREIDVSVTVSPIWDQAGRIVGASAIMRDIAACSHRTGAEALLAAIVTSSRDAIISKSLDGMITTWNAAAEKLLGFTDVEMIGSSIRRLIPDERQGEEDVILAKIAAGQRVEDLETVRICKDGRHLPVRITVSPVHSPDGSVSGASKIMRDITAELESREHVALLMREIDHRSKNALAVVQAIARQTVAATPDGFRDRFCQRIDALVANQDVLMAEKWKSADLTYLVRAQLAHFRDLLDERIVISGPSVQLVPAAAQAIGMALHELATNAGKYGALSNDSGTIHITWKLNSEEFSMIWQEEGGPVVVPPTRSGFGSKVITQMMEMGVNGEVGLKYRPKGVVWRLTCPTGNILSASFRTVSS
jgi:PAS domain S-box-containing protein